MNDFDITDIEKAVIGAVRQLSVTTHVWANRPKAVDDDIDDFIVVKVRGGVSDKAAFGQCRLSISLFARDVREMKNADRLSVMQKALYGLPLWLDKYLIDGHPRYIGDTPDDFGFHARIINYRLFIKAT